MLLCDTEIVSHQSEKLKRPSAFPRIGPAGSTSPSNVKREYDKPTLEFAILTAEYVLTILEFVLLTPEFVLPIDELTLPSHEFV